MGKHVSRGFERLYDGEYEEADREFRKADCHGGRALVAFEEGRSERAINKACKCLGADGDHFPHERDVVLKVIEVSLGEVDPGEMQRPEIVTSRAEDRIEDVSWEEVDEGVSEFVEEWPLFSDLVESGRPGTRDFKGEKIEEAFEFIKGGRLDEGFDILADLHFSFPDDPFLQAYWVASPGYVEDAPSELGLNEFRARVEDIVRLSEDVSDPVRASILGLCLFNLSIEYEDRKDVLERSEYLIESALDCFEFAGSSGVGGDFNLCFRGICLSFIGELEEAVEVLEEVPEDSEWYTLAKAAAEGSREEMETFRATNENISLLNAAVEAREKERKRDELQLLEEIDPGYFEGFIHRKGEEVDYGMVVERIAELKIDLGAGPEIGTLKRAVDHNPENEKVIERLVEEGEENLRDGDVEGALRYFEAVPEGHDDTHFLKNYGGALKRSRRYGEAEEVLGELVSEDPDFLLPLSDCEIHLGEREEATEDLKELFARSGSVPVLERGLEMAVERRILNDREIVELSEKLLEKSEKSDFASSVKEDAEERLKERRRRRIGELEEEGLELHEAGDHGEAIGKLSEVPEELMGHESAEALAESHRALGEYEEALRWYEELPGSVENISSEAVCYIKTGRYEEASELCEDLLGMIDEPGEVPDPDVQGLVLEKQGKYWEAAGKYEDDGLVERLLEGLEEDGEDRERILILEELHERSRDEEYLEMMEEAAMENEDELTVGFKSRLSVGGNRREIVVCDTNILVYKAFEEIEISPSSRGRIGSALRKFSQLASEGNRILLLGSVERELEPVCERKLEKEDDLGEEEKERVRERVERYREKYGPGDLPVNAPIEKEYMERAREFYRSYPAKLHEITERKISENPEKKHEILLKRAEMVPSKGATPGEADVRLLAECIRLSETPIPGVWGVSLLSNDSDFLWFSSEIEREFGIRVHDI